MNCVSNFDDIFRHETLAGGLGLLCNNWVNKLDFMHENIT